MKAALRIGEGAWRELPGLEPSHDLISARVPCPAGCGANPCLVHGDPASGVRTYDTETRGALCSACGERVGTLRVRWPTIFGLAEDARVLGGRARVY